MRVLTLGEIRELDRRAIEELGIPGLVLMENAALATVDALGDRFADARRIGLVCGPGNNGADGLAAARQLDARGYEVTVIQAAFGRALSPDCLRQREILAALGIEIVDLPIGFAPAELSPLAGVDLLVDALFGAGLTRPLDGDWARLVEGLGALERPCLAIDLPSGLDGDRDAPIGPCLEATVTVTFVAPKPALVLPPACDLAGEVVVADLGFRFDGGGGPNALHLLLAEELGAAVVPRRPEAHKGSFGHVLLVAGGRGKAGAMVLAARASVVAGAGLTTVALPAGLVEALAAGCPEAMSLPLPETGDGSLGLAALDALTEAGEARTVLAIGPGLGRHHETEELVRALASRSSRALVLDADGLNAFAGRLEELARRSAPTVLTPHPGELARLLELTNDEVLIDRLGAAREAARRSGAVVALKGRATIVAAPDGEAWINTTGNPGMASGGSGDVLTGIVAARLAQGDEASFAAALSVHLHGLAGDLAAARLGGPAVPASELLESWGEAWQSLNTE
ncbi:MAG TPA: NAD(P)H-hydrate dehydratase [Thermoanaerobaculia bacterium]|nr:NAD(P)H-hydrate dehydratase [Thermoanaerobaculia bacterium]